MLNESNIAQFAADLYVLAKRGYTPNDSSLKKIESIKYDSFIAASDYSDIDPNKAKKDDLQYGYYLVSQGHETYPNEGQIQPVVLVNVLSDVVVNFKSIDGFIEKTVNKSNTDIGQLVTFSIEGSITNDPAQKDQVILYFEDTLENMILTGEWDFSIDGKTLKSTEWGSNQENYLINKERYNYSYDDYWPHIQAILDNYNEGQITFNSNIASQRINYLTAFKNLMRNIYESGSEPKKGHSSFCFGIKLDPDHPKEYLGKRFELTYTAYLTDNASLGNDPGNINDVMCIIRRSDTEDFPATVNHEVHREQVNVYYDSCPVYTYTINLMKTDKENGAPLNNAQFALYKYDSKGNKVYYYYNKNAWIDPDLDITGTQIQWIDVSSTSLAKAYSEGLVSLVTTDENGKSSFPGIASGTYYLEEIKAPEGYNPVEQDIKVVISNDTPADFTVNVENSVGALLPETGGPGTASLFILGLFLTATSATLYFTTRKRHS